MQAARDTIIVWGLFWIRKDMKRNLTILIAATGAIVWIGGSIAHAAPENIGRADRIKNTVTGQIAGRRGPITVGDSVFQNQRIRTRSNSTAQFRFKDNTRLAVGANSSIVLDDAVFSGGTNDKLILKAARGAFRFASGRSKKDAYKVVTPSSTLGVRGTLFDVFVGRSGETIVLLLQGAVTACNSSGECQTIKDPCGCLRIDRNGTFTSSSGLSRAVLRGTRPSQASPFMHNQFGLLNSLKAPGWLVAKCTAASSTGGQDTEGSGDPADSGGDSGHGNGGDGGDSGTGG